MCCFCQFCCRSWKCADYLACCPLQYPTIFFVDICCSLRRRRWPSYWRQRPEHSFPHAQVANHALRTLVCRKSFGHRWGSLIQALPSVTYCLLTASFSWKYSFVAVIGCLATITTPMSDSFLSWLFMSVSQQAASPDDLWPVYFLM